jgi:hypothetical protein
MGRVVRRVSKTELVRGYVEFMYEKLLEWLEDDDVWYEDLDDMVEHAEEYIHEKIAVSDDLYTPCDNGAISVAMFVDYIFNNRLLTDDEIANDLLGWVFEPEDMKDCIRVVSCYEELLKFRDALKSIKVKVREVETGEG